MSDNNATYIHGTDSEEQNRLRLLNALTNPGFHDFLKIEEGQKVLEVGCGLGIMANEIAVKFPKSEVHGLEYAEEQLAQADYNQQNLHLIQGDAHSLPYEDNSFDVVYCRYVLEHVANPHQVMREMYRVLKKGGRCCVQENNIEILLFYPECPMFEKVWKQFIELQDLLGGDGTIGKKLYPLFKQAGFGKTELSIAPQIHGFEHKEYKDWVQNIIGNIESAEQELVEFQLATHEEIELSKKELIELKNDETGSGIFYWNRCEGIK